MARKKKQAKSGAAKSTSKKLQSAGDLTREQMDALTEISDRIDKLFVDDNSKQTLGPCMLTFSRPSGRANRLGFYRNESWGNSADLAEDRVPEIAINPEFLASHGFIEFIQTLTHEKCHQWQYKHGKPGRKGYHNIQFSQKMIAMGLQPIAHDKTVKHTCNKCGHQWPANEGGRDGCLKPRCGSTDIKYAVCGQSVGDKIIKGGVLDKFIKALPKKIQLPFLGLRPMKRLKKPSYVKFECFGCGDGFRAKPSLRARCESCDRPFRIVSR